MPKYSSFQDQLAYIKMKQSQIQSFPEHTSQHKSKFKTVIDIIVTLIDSQSFRAFDILHFGEKNVRSRGRRASPDFKEDKGGEMFMVTGVIQRNWLSVVGK